LALLLAHDHARLLRPNARHKASLVSSLAVATDTHVTIAYSIAEDVADGARDGRTSSERLTTSYVHGYGQVLPVLEKGLEGETQGAFVTLVADSDDAYGPHEAEGILELEREGLEVEAGLEPGEEIVATSDHGEMVMRVVEIRDDAIVVDTNHPLAGKRLRFDVEVLEVRPATDDEIQEAQDDLEDMIDDACGCGHDHGDEHDHANDEGATLLQISRLKPRA
jgi:FKBP-type peptidyl-prolyl cis-trans isomerase SlyD